jgi:hypothetical protein
MPLLSLLKTSPEAVEVMHIEQIVMQAGDGNLKDNSECQAELREYLTLIEPEKLAEHATHCLHKPKWADSGFVLQDVVNEIGRRLGFKVTNGRYRGVKGENGFDGLWHSDHVGAFLVETKTTSAYTIRLEPVAKYRDGLAEEGAIDRNTPILFVVGRDSTVALEQQIRGSKFAWSTRLVGVEALLKLMSVNLDSTTDEVTQKIHQIFLPVDYTRVDPIVDVVFTTSEDKAESEELTDAPVDDSENDKPKKKKNNASSQEVIKHRRQQVINALSAKFGKKLIKRKAALYSDSDDQLRVAVSVSKRYEDNKYQQYWYAYLAPMRSFLANAKTGLMVYACADKDEAYAIPYEVIEKLKEGMGTTPEKENRKAYWHVFIRDLDGPPRIYLPKTKEETLLSDYRLDLTAPHETPEN